MRRSRQLSGVRWFLIPAIICVMAAWSNIGVAEQLEGFSFLQVAPGSEDTAPPPETDQGWYFKPPYPDYAINGMPDFHQRQDGWWWMVGGVQKWTYCGPCAVGNCLWWFDSKFEPNPIPPPAINDGFRLISALGNWDDHDTSNVIPFIAQLGAQVGSGPHGTRINDLVNGTVSYINQVGLQDSIFVTALYPMPFPELILGELFRSQDVILLLGFWEMIPTGQWQRVGGHYVTVAGIDSNATQIALSDPWFDWAEQGHPVRVGNGILVPHFPIPGHSPNIHNDAGNVSHDGYQLVPGSSSPGGFCWLPDYPIMYDSAAIQNFAFQNCPTEFEPLQGEYMGGQIHTEIEYAMIICPDDMDFGDAPDGPYPSLMANNGARARYMWYEWLGQSVDQEVESYQVDMDNYDDGIIFHPPYIPGSIGIVDVIVTTDDAHGGRYAGTNVIYLHGWFDFNADGDWTDSGENVFCGFAVNPELWPAGQDADTVSISFTVPSYTIMNDTIWTRFRLDYNQNVNSITGMADWGEVEDHWFFQGEAPELLDFGDAPDRPYPSLLANNGARHRDFTQEWLGQSVDGEVDSRQVDLDNFDDGVILHPPYNPGGTGTVDVIVTATNPHGGRYTSSTPIYLHGWFDFNSDGDWTDNGENVFCGFVVNPSTWSAAQTQDTISISFTVPSFAVYGDTIWTRFRLDYAQNLNSFVGQADFGEVEDYWFIQEEEPPEFYFKPGYPDYAPSGMPDFDQKQAGWVTPGTNQWNHCGPVALANCLWWFDSKFEPDTIPPPTISDGYDLITAYGAWDDHDPSNVIPFVNDLATNYVNTTGGGTEVHDMYNGVLSYLNHVGLNPYYSVRLWQMPEIDSVCAEVLRSQDVILLLGFWENQGPGEWNRVGGHYVTMAGVDYTCAYVAYSDPYFDWAELGNPVRVLSGSLIPHAPIPGHAAGVHNDAGNISHDGYPVLLNSPSPGGSWGNPNYQVIFETAALQNFIGLNCPSELLPQQGPYTGGPISVEVEYALIVCPAEPEEMDFGDAPDPTYPSLLINNGARHRDFSYEWLGQSVDGEVDSRQIDLDNFDDGVIFHPPYAPGDTCRVDLIVTVTNPSSSRYSNTTPIYLHGWIDWNDDGDWDDPGDNIFSGYQVNPAAWTHGLNFDTTTIMFVVPNYVVYNDTVWTRFRLDYAQNLNSEYGMADYGEMEDYWFYQAEIPPPPPPEEGWYYKPGYPDYCNFGMPDFDQKQDSLGVHGIPGWQWTWCGPTAVANCLWWFDSKYQFIINPGSPPPPAINDDFNLVQQYSTTWDDHDASNVFPLISDLGNRMSMDVLPWPGTTVDTIQAVIDQWLQERGLQDQFYEHTVRQPRFDEVCNEVERCQDVILLIGFYGYSWEYERWCRFGGHFVTVAGVNRDSLWIAISDPYYDHAEGDPPPPHGPTVHNNANLVSGPHGTNWHDRYPVGFGGTVFGLWKINHYPLAMGPIDNFMEQNFTPELWSQFWCFPPPWPTHTEVEYAIMVSPHEPDFGDAPDPTYPSLLASNGARHLDFSQEWLGQSVDGELDSRQIDADNFDDGVVFYPPYTPGGVGQIDVTVTVANPMSLRYSAATPIFIHGWIDWTGDGDWNDPGENIFCGVPVNPSIWPAGQNSETVTLTFTVPPSGIAYGDTIWSRFRLDYNQNLNSVVGAADFGEVEDYPLVIECPEPPEEGWYYKPGYPDYCDFGIPDFDQKQTDWGDSSATGWVWTHCGPVALANCMWWFDSKFEYWTNPLAPPPPAISDLFPLVPQFGAWDDHATQNVRPLVANLANLASTNVHPFGLGTDVDSLASAFRQIMHFTGLDAFNVFDVRVIHQPTFAEVYNEVSRSQDVILLIGYWTLLPSGEWCRYGGHFITTAGVWWNLADQPWIAISDPYFDHAEGGPPPPHGSAVHNNANLISGPHGTNWHDQYPVILNSPSPGGLWALDCYPMDFNYIKNFYRQNFNYELMPFACTDSLMAPTNVEVEYALIICPTADYEDLDFGDAPDPTYPSLLLSNGARHFDFSHEWLGEMVDGELESNQVDADLFDDGVVFMTQYTPGNPGTVNLIVSVANPTDVRYDTANIYLHGWFDWNLDGDWDDPGENVFSGFMVDPNTWPAGQVSQTVSITFNVPASAALSDTFWTRFRLDYAENLNSPIGAAQFGEVEDYLVRQELPHGFYFKPAYPNYALMGMPDFDQHQDNWQHPLTGRWTFCGPVAVANCFWWFDSKYDIAGVPGDGFDQFPLVRDYLDGLLPNPGIWQDDHCFNNVNDLATPWPTGISPPTMPPFTPGFQNPPILPVAWGELVERLAWIFDTDGIRTGSPHSGTFVFTMEDAIDTLLVRAHLDTLLYEHTIERPGMDTIRHEVLRCQDVILLLGFWELQYQPYPEWVRVGGHYVTVAGVDTMGDWIAVSDPCFDWAIAGGPGRFTVGHPPSGMYPSTLHNDAQWVSHDYYQLVPNSPSPGGDWFLPEYPVSMDPTMVVAFLGQNDPFPPTPIPPEWQGGPIHTELEYAVVVSPYEHELNVVIQRDTSNTYIQLVWDPIPTAQGYKIYRSTDPGFTPSPATYVTTVPKTDSIWTDPTVNLPSIKFERYFYRMIVVY